MLCIKIVDDILFSLLIFDPCFRFDIIAIKKNNSVTKFFGKCCPLCGDVETVIAVDTC